MKKMRKLLPAIAMLLVSAVMMSTASFAWFTMNSSVEATGMKVTAVAPASLWIKNDDDAGYVSATTLKNENDGVDEQFKPAAVDATTAFDEWTFKQLTDEASADVKIDGTIADDDKAFEPSESFYMDKFLLKLESTAGDQAELSVKVKVSDLSTTKTDEIWRALRVAVVTADQTLTFKFDNDPENKEEDDPGTLATYTAEQKFDNKIAAGGTDTTVVVYVWVEGDDADCMNANALNTDTFQIDIVFGIGTVTAGTPGSGT